MLAMMNGLNKMTNLEYEDIKKIAELPYNWEQLNDKTLLISGGTGFIGSFICDVIRYRNKKFGSNVHVISLSRHGGKSDDTVTQVVADITNPIDCDENVDYVLHLASNTHPAQYAVDPVGTITTNILGCNNLLRLAVKKKSKRFLLASSVEIYGQGTEEPLDELYDGYLDCNNARAGYNEAKRTCEALSQSYKSQYGVDVVIARLARTIGADHKKDSKAIAQFFQAALDGRNIILKSNGKQKYSYLYVADAASGILTLLINGKNGEAYNVSAVPSKNTLADYARFIANLAGVSVVYDYENNTSVSKATNALLSIDKLKNLGWTPCYTVEEALARTYLIYKKRKYELGEESK